MDESTGSEETPARVPFLGREAELAYLASWVRPHQVLALVGEGDAEGVGATALARAYAGTCGAPLVLTWSIPEDGPRPHVALRRWAAVLGLEATGLALQGDLLDTVAAGLAARAGTLVVIDGVREEDLASVAQVLTLRSLDVSLLLTCPVASVAQKLGARPVVVEPLLEEEGQAMLEAVVGSAVPPIIALTILQAVDYLPLGIRLAGSRIRHARADESSGLWGGRLDPERVAWLGGAAGVARGFLDVYRRLDDDAQRTFRALGAVRYGPVRATRIAPLLDASVDETEATLGHLAAYGLIASLDDADGWRVHPVLGVYARRLSEETGEGEVWRRRRLGAVIAADGREGAGVDHADVLDVIETTIAEGSTDDLVALATRVVEEVRGWCHEEASDLVARAVTAAREDGHRAAGMLQRVLDALLEEQARSDAEDLLEVDDALVELVDEPPDELALEELEPEDDGVVVADEAFLLAHGLTLDDADAEPDLQLEAPEGAGPTDIFDVRRLLAEVGGSPEGRGAQEAQDAADEAESLHQQATARVAAAVADAGPSPEPAVAKALDALVAAARKVTDQVRRARAAAATAQDADPSIAERMADRASRARDAAVHAMAVVEAAWAGVHDAVAEAAELRAHRTAAAQGATRDVAVARQALDEAQKRLRTRRATVDDDADTWGELEELLRDAGAWLTEAEDLAATIDAAGTDPEDVGSRVRGLRERVEDVARDVLGRASRRLRTVRAEEQREDVLREAHQQLGRFEQDADWVNALCDELAPRLEGHEDAESLELRARVAEIRAEIRMHRDVAREAARRLEDAAEATWLGLQERISTATRAVAAALSDTERLRVDVETWAADHQGEDPELVLAALRSDAATALAALESTAAVARRAIARAHQAVAHADLPELGERTATLRAREAEVRDAVATARVELQRIVEAREADVARGAWRAAEERHGTAVALAEVTRDLAEEVLAVADADRRARLQTAIDEGQALAGRVADTAGRADATLEAVGEGALRLGDAGLGARVDEVRRRTRAARDAADDGLRRLGQTRDPAFADRLVEALHDAADVVAAAMVEAETLRAGSAAELARVDDPAARAHDLAARHAALGAAVETLQADLEALREGADASLRAVLTAATGDARREAAEARELLSAASVAADDDEGRQERAELLDVVDGLVARASTGLRSAQSLVAAALARRRVREQAEAAAALEAATSEEITEEGPRRSEGWLTGEEEEEPEVEPTEIAVSVAGATMILEDLDDDLDPTDIVPSAMPAESPAEAEARARAEAVAEAEAEAEAAAADARRVAVAAWVAQGRGVLDGAEEAAREAFAAVAQVRAAVDGLGDAGLSTSVLDLAEDARGVRAGVEVVEALLDDMPDDDPVAAERTVGAMQEGASEVDALLASVRARAAELEAVAEARREVALEAVQGRDVAHEELVVEAREVLARARREAQEAGAFADHPLVAPLLPEVEQGVGALVGLVEAAEAALARVEAATDLRDAEEASTEAGAGLAVLPDARDVLVDTLDMLAEAVAEARAAPGSIDDAELPAGGPDVPEEEEAAAVEEPTVVVSTPMDVVPSVEAVPTAHEAEAEALAEDVGLPEVAEPVPAGPRTDVWHEDDEYEVSEIRELFAEAELSAAMDAVDEEVAPDALPPAEVAVEPGDGEPADLPAPGDPEAVASLAADDFGPTEDEELDEITAVFDAPTGPQFELEEAEAAGEAEAPAPLATSSARAFVEDDEVEVSEIRDLFGLEELAAVHDEAEAAESEEALASEAEPEIEEAIALSAEEPEVEEVVALSAEEEPEAEQAIALSAEEEPEAEEAIALSADEVIPLAAEEDLEVVEAVPVLEADALEPLSEDEDLPEVEVEALDDELADPETEAVALVLSDADVAAMDARVSAAAAVADAAFRAARAWPGPGFEEAAQARAVLSRAVAAYEVAREHRRMSPVVTAAARVEEASRLVRLAAAAVRPPELVDAAPRARPERPDRAGPLLQRLATQRVVAMRQGTGPAVRRELAEARAAVAAAYAPTAPGHADAVARLQRILEVLEAPGPEPTPHASPRVASAAFEEARTARAAGGAGALEAAARAVAVAGSAGPAEARAALRLQLARAALAAGEVDTARRALVEARGLSDLPELAVAADLLGSVLDQVPSVPSAPATWVASAEAFRRARRTVGP
ncbi:MAG: hypothetical protein H6732_09790 [Alphaproteobacteria bacterium]|nr:hypothetical protein [Alphaproteobacteria bacterium]